MFTVPIFSGLRLASILVVFVLWRSLSLPNYVAVYFSIVMGHYLLALLFSGKQIRQVLGQTASRPPFAALLSVTGLLVFFVKPSIDVYFGLHHALNEAYATNTFSGDSQKRWDRLDVSRFFFNLFTYYVIARSNLSISNVFPAWFLAAGWAVSLVLMAYFLFRARSSMERSRFLDYVLMEALALVLVGLSLQYKFETHYVMMYHFIFWILFPALKTAMRGAGPSHLAYFAWTAVVTGAFSCLFTWLWGRPFMVGLTYPQMVTQVALWGYVHITLSLALSSANPRWIRRVFASG